MARETTRPDGPGAGPILAFAFEARVRVGAALDFGNVTHGRRRIVEILGGTFEGPGLEGRVLPGGAEPPMARAFGLHLSRRTLPGGGRRLVLASRMIPGVAVRGVQNRCTFELTE